MWIAAQTESQRYGNLRTDSFFTLDRDRSSHHVNDASAYRTAIVHSHISTCKAANVAPNMDGGYPGKEPILTAESGRTPALQPKKINE